MTFKASSETYKKGDNILNVFWSVHLDESCHAGRQAEIDVERYRNEVAALSRDVDDHGLGSVRSLLSVY
jgi:hypothetical protein